jgi:hypothetical protein
MDAALKGDLVSPAHTIGLHCQPNDLMQEADDAGKIIPIGVNASAFEPDDDGASVGWLEYYEGPIESQIAQVVECMKVRKVRKSHRLALFNVGQILKCGTQLGINIEVSHDPLDNYECHSLITGYDSTKSELMGFMALQFLSLNEMMA